MVDAADLKSAALWVYRFKSGGGHTSPPRAIVSKLMVPDNVGLLQLPSYSPELTPMENVPPYPGTIELSALVWDTQEDIDGARKTT